MQIQISWLLQKPTDLDLHCLQNRVYQGSAGQGLMEKYDHPGIITKYSSLNKSSVLSMLNPGPAEPGLCPAFANSVALDQLASEEFS